MTPGGVMIFAAGLGTRMRPLTDDRPKPLIKIGDTTLINHTLGLTGVAHLSPSVVNTHYLSDQMADHLHGKDVIQSHEPILLDTGGGLKQAARHFDTQAIFTTNSDAVWSGPNPFDVLRAHWTRNMRALLLLAPVTQVMGRDGTGDFDITENGQITRGGPYLFLGAQIITLDAVTSQPETIFSLNLVWDALIKTGQAFGCLYPGKWCDVGRPENIPTAEKLLQNDI